MTPSHTIICALSCTPIDVNPCHTYPLVHSLGYIYYCIPPSPPPLIHPHQLLSLDLAIQLQRSIVDVMTTSHLHESTGSTGSTALHDHHGGTSDPSPNDKLDVLLDVVRDLQSELKGVRALAQEQTSLLQVRYLTSTHQLIYHQHAPISFPFLSSNSFYFISSIYRSHSPTLLLPPFFTITLALPRFF